MTEPTPVILPNIQALRFVAAAGVFIAHVQYEAGKIYEGFHPFTPLLWQIGVDVFFTISGFIMYLLSGSRFGEPGYSRTFITRRIVRIMPLYWLFTTLALLVMLRSGIHVANDRPSLVRIITSYFFIPLPRMDGAQRPILGLGWTLEYEIFFYCLFAIALLFRRGLAMLLCAFAALVAMHARLPAGASVLIFWSDPIILLFLLGIGVACIRRTGVRLGGWVALVLAIAGIILLLGLRRSGLDARAPSRVIWSALPSFMLVAAAALYDAPALSGRIRKLLVAGGDASYALYLSHPFTIQLVGKLVRHSDRIGPRGFIAIASLAAVAVAVATHRYLERPAIALIGARASARRARMRERAHQG